MKAYYEYDDGSFWAIRTEGGDCFTSEGSKYEDFWPDAMLKAGTEEEKKWRMPPNAKRLPFENPEAAEQEAEKMSAEKRVSALEEDAEFWRIAIEINAYLLFFVPDEFMTKELCALAVGRKGGAIHYVPFQMRSRELYKQAVFNDFNAFAYIDENEKSEELCIIAVEQSGIALEFVPEKFRTKEVYFAAVRNYRHMLKFVDVSKLTKEEYTEICRLAFEGE